MDQKDALRLLHQDALRLLHQVGCPSNVIEHSKTVSKKAVAMTRKAQKDYTINIHIVKIGGLLHDIGRAVTHGIDHGIVGAQLLKQKRINTGLQRICERHVCAGIPAEVAKDIGLPARDFIPVTIEEKIVCHADNVTNHTIDELRKGWKNFFGEKNGEIIVTLLDQLHQELKKYID
jgi:uncharacterized protein